jgi:Trypsin-like serine proteases, typically periplasmic, contain C-terminal PDZ domain
MHQLLEHGEIKRGLLGVQIQDLSSDLADAMNLKGVHGALVSRVTPKSAAEKAGIKAGDVIVTVNGKKLPEQVHYGLALALSVWANKSMLSYSVINNARLLKLR